MCIFIIIGSYIENIMHYGTPYHLLSHCCIHIAHIHVKKDNLIYYAKFALTELMDRQSERVFYVWLCFYVFLQSAWQYIFIIDWLQLSRKLCHKLRVASGEDIIFLPIYRYTPADSYYCTQSIILSTRRNKIRILSVALL